MNKSKTIQTIKFEPQNVLVVGASGGIGSAIVDTFANKQSTLNIFASSRKKNNFKCRKIKTLIIDYFDEATFTDAVKAISANVDSLDLILITTGFLHNYPDYIPEKSWKSINSTDMIKSYHINCVGPALVARYMLPLLSKEKKTVFAALSARVGSISDNKLGGWYSYRCSKAALNMVIRNLSIELSRLYPKAICVGLHPGTVDTRLSSPFLNSVPRGKLFSPQKVAVQLVDLISDLEHESSGKIHAWNGSLIEY